MANESNPTFQIPRDVIEPIIQAHVTSAVTQALGGQARLLEVAIARVLTQKVDRDGKASSGYSGDTEFIQWAMNHAVRVATQKAIEEELGKHKEKLKTMIAAELGKSRSPLVRSLVEGMVSAMTHPDVLKYRIHVQYDGK